MKGKEQAAINLLHQAANLSARGGYTIKAVLSDDSIKALKRNKELENLYKGDTCFILGNGPSLKLESRLNELRDYIVFSVNQFYRSNLFDVVQPNYHVMADPLFFELDSSNPSEAEVLNLIAKCAQKKNIRMIYPAEKYHYTINNFGFQEENLYFYSKYFFTDNYIFGFDMSKYLPRFRNVVQYAICCAIYMGFSKIVILGCDMTGILDNYVKRSPNFEIETFSHVYDYTENEKQRMTKVNSLYDNEFMLSGFAQMFHDFRILKECCDKRGIKLLNATKETALDSLPFVTLEDILDGVV